jgi:hypothetical protein
MPAHKPRKALKDDLPRQRRIDATTARLRRDELNRELAYPSRTPDGMEEIEADAIHYWTRLVSHAVSTMGVHNLALLLADAARNAERARNDPYFNRLSAALDHVARATASEYES